MAGDPSSAKEADTISFGRIEMPTPNLEIVISGTHYIAAEGFVG